MTAGLQIWNAAGVLMFDATTRCGRVVFMQRVTSGSGSFSDARLGQGTPFVVFQADGLPVASASSTSLPPTVSISGTTVSYAYGSGSPIAGWLIAGVY